MESLSEFMKKELIYYINQEVKKGKPLPHIRHSLLNLGHSSTLVDHVISVLQKNDFEVTEALKAKLPKDIEDHELYYDVLNSLIKYIEYRLENKDKLSTIKRSLIEYGHSTEDIEQAINHIKSKNSIKINHVLLPAIFLTFLGIVMFASSSTGEPISLVMMAFYPVLVTIGVNVALFFRLRQLLYLWATPLAMTIIFYYSASQSPVYQNMDVMSITSFNILLGLAYTFAITNLSRQKQTRPKEYKVETKQQNHSKENEQGLKKAKL